LEEVKVRAKALFATLDLPQTPDALLILDDEGRELFFWNPGAKICNPALASSSPRGFGSNEGAPYPQEDKPVDAGFQQA
jgi:hypothetical protein